VLKRSRWSAFVMAMAAVLLPLAVMYSRRVARYSELKGDLGTSDAVLVFLLAAPILVWLASLVLYSQYSSPIYYGVSGGLRWAVFGATFALLSFASSYIVPLPDRDGNLLTYLLTSLINFVVFIIIMVLSYRVAFRGSMIGEDA
jgi:hypothetical protein